MNSNDGWWADDGQMAVHYPDATTAHEAAREYVADGDYRLPAMGEGTYWVRVHTWQYIGGARRNERTIRVPVHPEEPSCSGPDGHVWDDDGTPGFGSVVRGHGGGVVTRERCAHCGIARKEDTWAQCPSTGVQGLRSIRYLPAE